MTVVSIYSYSGQLFIKIELSTDKRLPHHKFEITLYSAIKH